MQITNEEIGKGLYQREWLITNGIGGYAMSTVCGMNTRKYHGLLVAAVGENSSRYVVLPKINEEVEIDSNVYSIATNECPNYFEKGYQWETFFVKEYLPEFFYQVHGVEILKKISLVHGENKVAITYDVKTNDHEVTLKLSPLVNYRDFHQIKNMFYAPQEEQDNVVKVGLNGKNNLFIKVSEADYHSYYHTYYQNMFYREEKERGFESLESHFMPGYFEIKVGKKEEKVIELVASLNDSLGFQMKANATQLIKKEETRLQKYCKMCEAHTEIEKTIVIAADQFLIEKPYGKTVIAGYPWFGDWGRDTFISLEGLLLKTNRFHDAKSVLKTFANHLQNGLVPNMIDEKGGHSYNSVDASLWYIEAIYQYYRYTNDLQFIKEMYSTMKEIIECYQKGTLYGIHMEEDGLISAGSQETQLTWMDAKVGEIIPTPRNGKAVEVNALWYNALCIMQLLSEKLSIPFEEELIVKVKKSFEKFYADKGLLDTIEPTNSQIRPNQIFAISLSFPVVPTQKAVEILEVIEEDLLTNRGLKTLSAKDSQYRARYEGDALSRDTSYHQGTVWPWLLMEYQNACYQVKRMPKVAAPIEEMLQEGCIGSVCEIYDAEEPRRPRGAPAQAWSVAMLL